MMTIPDSISPRKISDEVRDRLIDLIQGDGMTPGTPIPSERELMAQYGVGRPAIREAMQHLQLMGLITIRHGERPKIAEPKMDGLLNQLAVTMKHALLHSEGSLEHLKQARSVLEEASCTIAALNRTPEDIAELSALIDQQSKAANDGRTFLDLDQQFHTKIALISGNPIFEALTQSVFEWMKEFHHEAVRSVGLEPLTISEHREILTQITAQNAPQAAFAMKQHLERANSLYHQEHVSNG